jgi:hypothetical protein
VRRVVVISYVSPVRGGTLFISPAPAPAAAPVLLRARLGAVARLAAQLALARVGVGAAANAAPEFGHALDGFGEALIGSPSNVLAREARVDVAEDAAAEPLAELPLRLGEALMRRHAEPPRRLEHVRLGSGAAVQDALEHAQEVLGLGGVVLDGYLREPLFCYVLLRFIAVASNYYTHGPHSDYKFRIGVALSRRLEQPFGSLVGKARSNALLAIVLANYPLDTQEPNRVLGLRVSSFRSGFDSVDDVA